MKTTVLFASIILASGLFLVNCYNSVIDARAWGANIPQSILTTRAYYSSVNPGNFFRILSPVNQILALTVLILFWKSAGQVRFYLGMTFIIYVLVDVFTFAYFYPRLGIMFQKVPLADINELRQAWSQWSAFNWLRSLMLLAGIVLASVSLHKIYMFMQLTKGVR